MALQSLGFSKYTARLDLGQPLSLKDLIDFYDYSKGRLSFRPFQGFYQEMKAKAADVARRWVDDSPKSDAVKIMAGIARGFIVTK